ncbi:conserved hypothetical protein [Perkinsus marinus ATCC 50983]|uniref:Rieske domain-containing protein n=1 Tax=Perkinsus marinus (strain ATCC 50983 / TXsc) TaxID=423536 RepID=C5LU80_PERM5|nr:conserved hypothetical protein [Perkinsus marinus ATCC 50983]EEQ99613.1 conserved hypothetical protein [Perkinsus marinus ATCC 50983]|eukprot:XP_002766896.1 conserved hypothetical protein [Perkinsus marinus ATCC 50983]
MSSSSSSTPRDGTESDGESQRSSAATANENRHFGLEGSQWHAVCTLARLRREGRVHTQVDGRFVSVLYDPRPQSGSKAPIIYCLDSICYHMGGPLTTGDIEDIDGIPSLSCPWHQYKINLRDGSRLSRPVTFDPKTRRPIPGKWESGPKCVQRIHDVRCTADGQVEVRLTMESSQPVLSDKYAYSSRAARNLTIKGSSPEQLDSSRPSPCVMDYHNSPRKSKKRLCARRSTIGN